MAMKGYFTFLKAPGLEPHHQMQLSVISGHSGRVQSAYSTADRAGGNLRRSLLRFSTRPNEWGTQ